LQDELLELALHLSIAGARLHGSVLPAGDSRDGVDDRRNAAVAG
jgi:hypothetical protein